MSIDVVVLARFLLTGIALFLALLAAVTWNRRKDVPEAVFFAAIMAALAVYVFGYSGEIAQTTVATARFWLDIEYLALPWVPGLWLLGVSRQNNVRIRPAIFFVIPVITFAGHYTNFKHLFYTAPMAMVHRGPFWVLTVQRGPLSTLDNAYLLVAFVVGSILYISRLRFASALFRRQAIVLLTASFLPFVGYFTYLADLSPWGLDIAPVTLCATAILLYYGLFHCGIFDLAPLARDLIFHSMRDAVIVIDPDQRLLDFNPAAQALLPVFHARVVGKQVPELLKDSPDLLRALNRAESAVEFNFGDGDSMRSYEMSTWPLQPIGSTGGSRIVGRAVILSDVTDQVALREELRRRSETDSLTGVANRRRFHQALEIECLRFSRGHAPLSVLMIDLDHFKDVNDRFGHPAGDAVLRGVAQLLLASLRKTDLVARYGGEEFSVLLPETRCEGANVIAERIRENVSRVPFDVGDVQVGVTVSVGVASHATDHEVDPQILLKKADLALYRAKTAGRNRVEVM